MTDTGRRRLENEDAMLIETLPDGGLLAAIADGMGGLAHGGLASAAAIGALQVAIASDASAAGLIEGFRAGHQRIRDLTPMGGDPMGTTLVAVLIRDRHAHVFNVGDSRAYLVEAGSATQVTRDHSLVASQLEAGLIDKDEARTSPMRNVLTRALGPDAFAPDIDQFGPLSLSPDASLVLCSDGLHTLVSDEEIAQSVRQLPPQAATSHLVDLANERGGADNISVIVITNS